MKWSKRKSKLWKWFFFVDWLDMNGKGCVLEIILDRDTDGLWRIEFWGYFQLCDVIEKINYQFKMPSRR